MDIVDFKEKHKNEKCFVVGNGPSLDKIDLKAVNDYISIGCNSIFMHKTFTPTYYTAEDWTFISNYFQYINNWKGPRYKFVAKRFSSNFIKGDDVVYIDFIRYKQDPDDITSYNFVDKEKGIFYWGGTVTVLLLQLAYYMGCNPIYLIGVDHVDSDSKNPLKHFKDDTTQFTRPFNETKVSRLNYGYKTAERYLSSKGIKVFNATPNSKLEIFKKIDFEDAIDD